MSPGSPPRRAGRSSPAGGSSWGRIYPAAARPPSLVCLVGSPGHTMQCLDIDKVLEHLAGRLSPARAAAVLEHLDGCSACRQLMVDGTQVPFDALVVAAGGMARPA